MKYIVTVAHYVSGQGCQYTETIDNGITETAFTAAEWNAKLDEPFADTDTTWEEITVEFYADDDADPMFDDAIGKNTYKTSDHLIDGQFIPVSEADYRQEGAPAAAYVAIDAIRVSDTPDEDGCVDLYELVYTGDDIETIDFDHPAEIRETGYGWNIFQSRRF